MKKTFIRLCLAGALLFVGCGKGYHSSVLRYPKEFNEITCIAVLPFDSVSTSSGESPGKIFATILANKLTATSKFKILEWEELDGILRSQNVTLSASIDQFYAARLGDILSVEGVLFGSITEYGYKRGGAGFDAVPVVGVMAKLLSVKKRDVIWSSSYAMSSRDFLDTKRDPLTRVAMIVADKVAGAISSKVKNRKLDYGTVCWNPFVSSDLDNDGILNFADACPLQAENFNGILDTDGCPEVELVAGNFKQLVELKENKIVYKGTIEYVSKEATLLPSSIPILKGIASLINEHPEIKSVTIEGFSQDTGSGKFSEEFSFNRAMSIKNYLMKEGIPNEKLTAIGYEKVGSLRRSPIKEIEFSIIR